MTQVYLDHAATTYLYPEVIEEMTQVLVQEYGNPSSTHARGRAAKVILESCRKRIAAQLGASAQEILFTSGGTEANNWIIQNAVEQLGVKRIITTKTEHHAVLYPVLEMQKKYGIEVEFLPVSPKGQIEPKVLELLLQQPIKTLVSIMHVNNETGVIHDIQALGTLCQEHQAYFHSDTVQSVGKMTLSLQDLPVDFITASAHKFHGPKGVGFLFVRKNIPMLPLFFGGEQEKGLRAGTEPLHQIAGMTLALELSLKQLPETSVKVKTLRSEALRLFEEQLPRCSINGSLDGFYTILNLQLPISEEKATMLLFSLDLKGIAVSRGSACQSGSSKPSHVLAEMLSPDELKKPYIRISLDATNTIEEIKALIEALKSV
jgi:cysteine desulfurase